MDSDHAPERAGLHDRDGVAQHARRGEGEAGAGEDAAVVVLGAGGDVRRFEVDAGVALLALSAEEGGFRDEAAVFRRDEVAPGELA